MSQISRETFIISLPSSNFTGSLEMRDPTVGKYSLSIWFFTYFKIKDVFPTLGSPMMMILAGIDFLSFAFRTKEIGSRFSLKNLTLHLNSHCYPFKKIHIPNCIRVREGRGRQKPDRHTGYI